MFTTDRVVCTTDTDVHTTVRVNDRIVRTTDRVIIIPTEDVYIYNQQGNVHK